MATLGLAVGSEATDGNQPALLAATGLVGEAPSDAFERAALGPSWSVHAGTPGIVAGSDLGLLAGSIAILSWTGPLPADQFSEAEVAAGIDARMQRQVFVRRRAPDSARYAFHYNLGVSPQRWELKYDGVPTPQTRLLATALTPGGPVSGDVIRIEARGSTLRGYKNGRLVLQAQDTAAQRIVGGAAGAAFVLMGESVARPSPVFERWAGGGLAAPEPRLTLLSRSSSRILDSSSSDCFVVRFASSVRARHAFTVTNSSNVVVWREVASDRARVRRVVRWCGRARVKAPNRARPLPPGGYRAKLEVTAVPAQGRAARAPFFTRTWSLGLR